MVRWTRPITRRLAIALAVVLLAGCSYGGIAPVESASSVPVRTSNSRPETHLVSRGDTLYSIAWHYGFDYRQLAAWNAIREPYTIYPGQPLRLTQPPRTASTPSTQRPGASVEANTRQVPASTRSKSARAPATPANSPPESTARAPTSKTTASSADLNKDENRAAKGGSVPVKRWQWPARGEVVTSFASSDGKGIDIAGTFGAPIVAASDGHVVYSGSGLIGYGQLIIVKHNKRYLSAYAHNNKILVKEGDTVMGGQRIAEMGRSGSNRALLHFEIRRDGKPIDPVRYLPK